MHQRILRRLVRGFTLAGAFLAVSASAASAHIQVTPKVAAPNDSVKFTLLVPGEREQQTRRVELKVPAGVLPFSFSETPGWKRRAVPAGNGGIDRIVWTGRLAADGFVEFSFLAGTPERAGTISWKAIQVYSDGKVVRWIGPPGSEHPASTTRLVAGLAPQNAGGEGASSPTVPGTADAAQGSSEDTDWLARGIGLAALIVGAAGIAMVLAARRKDGGADR